MSGLVDSRHARNAQALLGWARAYLEEYPLLDVLLSLAQAIALAALLSRCVTLPRPDAVRDTIHARHTDCLARVAQDEHAHGVNAMAGFWCDAEEERQCRAAQLEKRCGEWQAVP